MKLPTKPENPEDWNIEIIDELIKYSDIESDSFDFKSEINKLYEDICAMANTGGGFIVLGISEIKSTDSQKILGFKKEGFAIGKQDKIGLEIGNEVLNIEPNPKVIINHVKDGSVFYSVIKIEEEISKKPFMVKNKSQFFVRIGNSSRPANRTTIMNLFSYSIEQIKNIENLRSSTKLLLQDLTNTRSHIDATDWSTVAKIPTIDLSLMRNAILLNETFLSKNNLLEINGDNVTKILHSVEWLNTYIRSFNDSPNNAYKENILNYVQGRSSTLRIELDGIPQFLNKIIRISNETLTKFRQYSNT